MAVSVIGLLALVHFTDPANSLAETLRWTKTYCGDGGSRGEGVAVGPDGSIYVTGDVVVGSQGWNLLLQKYLPTGARLRSKTYDGRYGGDDHGFGVAVGPDASVYVTGTTHGVAGRGEALFLRKYSRDGALRRFMDYDAPADDRGRGVAVGSDGSICVTGSTVAAGLGQRLLLRKYFRDGSFFWSRTFKAGSGEGQGSGVAVGPDLSIYVTGYVYGGRQGQNLLLQKYSGYGGLRWSRTYDGAANGNDQGNGVAVGPDGSIYVTGSTSVEGQGLNLLLQKYSPAGVRLWSRTYNGAANGDDEGMGVAVGSDRSVYVTGYTSVAGQEGNLLLQKYLPSGALRWSKTYNGAASGNDRGKGVTVGRDRSIYVSGSTWEGASQGLINPCLLLQRYR